MQTAADPPSPSTSPPPPRLRGAARALALEIAAEARAEWGYTTDIVATAFRKRRTLGSGDRRLIAETVYGLVRWDRRLDAIIDDILARGRDRARRAALAPAARGELKLLIHEVRNDGVPVAAVAEDVRRLVRAEVNPALIAGESAGLAGRTGIDREAVRLSYPTWLLERFADELGRAEALEVAEVMNRRAPLTVRVNTLKISRGTLAARLAEEGIVTRPTAFSPVGLILETRVNAFGLRPFQEGLFEVMDEGSQLVAEVVAPPPRGRVVDACAGAGGKTLALSALAGGQGRILALDTSGRKLEELRRRARRAGLSNVFAREIEDGGGFPADARGEAWDRVLVDAPCSGLGTLRRNPEARWRLTAQAVNAFPARQLSLLVTYAPLVAVGGRLIYATCTLLRSENQRVIERFLAERPGFVLMPVKEIWGKERADALGDGSFLEVTPQRHDTDAFFAAVLRRVK